MSSRQGTHDGGDDSPDWGPHPPNARSPGSQSLEATQASASRDSFSSTKYPTITRLVQGLERAGYVERLDCRGRPRLPRRPHPAGVELMRDARETHLEGVAELSSDRYTDEELETLSRLLERLPA